MRSKKELKEEYQRRKSRMGVYQIRNTANGRIFVGSSSDLDAIWNRYSFQLDMGSHQNAELQREWKAFGKAQFVYEVLGEIEQSDDPAVDLRKEVRMLEEMYLEELQPYGERGYNRKPKN